MKLIKKVLFIFILFLNIILLNNGLNVFAAEEQKKGRHVTSAAKDEDGNIIGTRWDCVEAYFDLNCAPIGSYIILYNN
jgi:hypothetical protein